MDRIVLGNLDLDRARFETRIDGEFVGLTYIQFELLHHLATHADRVVESDRLLQAIWGTAPDEANRKLRVHVSRLRKRIAASWPWRIKTVTKRGYALVDVEGEPPRPGHQPLAPVLAGQPFASPQPTSAES
jgi:DNA-binding response OmpR family regulator